MQEIVIDIGNPDEKDAFSVPKKRLVESLLSAGLLKKDEVATFSIFLETANREDLIQDPRVVALVSKFPHSADYIDLIFPLGRLKVIPPPLAIETQPIQTPKDKLRIAKQELKEQLKIISDHVRSVLVATHQDSRYSARKEGSQFVIEVKGVQNDDLLFTHPPRPFLNAFSYEPIMTGGSINGKELFSALKSGEVYAVASQNSLYINGLIATDGTRNVQGAVQIVFEDDESLNLILSSLDLSEQSLPEGLKKSLTDLTVLEKEVNDIDIKNQVQGLILRALLENVFGSSIDRSSWKKPHEKKSNVISPFSGGGRIVKFSDQRKK